MPYSRQLMQNPTPMQQALNNSEALVRTLFEQDAIGVAQIETATGRFARINQRYCDILGYTRQEMEGIDWQSITHPDDLPENLNNLQRFIEGQIRCGRGCGDEETSSPWFRRHPAGGRR